MTDFTISLTDPTETITTALYAASSPVKAARGALECDRHPAWSKQGRCEYIRTVRSDDGRRWREYASGAECGAVRVWVLR